MISYTLSRFIVLLETISSALFAISEEKFSLKINSAKWSKREMLGHLADSAVNNHQRFMRVQYETIPTIRYNQNKWNLFNHYQQLPGKHIIHFRIIYNQLLLEIMKRVSEENLLKKCNAGNDKNATLPFLMDDYVFHVQHHLRQIVNGQSLTIFPS